jgi:hypothetical protein
MEDPEKGLDRHPDLETAKDDESSTSPNGSMHAVADAIDHGEKTTAEPEFILVDWEGPDDKDNPQNLYGPPR